MTNDEQRFRYLAIVDNSREGLRPSGWFYEALMDRLTTEGLLVSTAEGYILSASGKQELARGREALQVRDGEAYVGHAKVSPGRAALETLERCSDPEGYMPPEPFTAGMMLGLERRGWAIQRRDRFALSPGGTGELARQRAAEATRLGVCELRERAESIEQTLRDIADRLSVQNRPDIDEEYKVKQWYRHLTAENFDELDALVKALSEGFEKKIGQEL